MISLLRKVLHIFSLFLFLSLIGCGENMKRELGFGKRSPDEYQVLRSRDLSVPPNFNLPPPGSENQVQQESENIIFEEDSKDKKLTEDDNSILILSEADKANPRIREIMDQESESELISLDKSLLDKILDGDPLIGSRDTERAEIVNATEEKERINESLQQGEQILGDDVPTIKRNIE